MAGAGSAALGAISLGLAFAATVAFPLAVYTAVLALFGLAHVLCELNYLDRRFGARLAGGILPWLSVPILGAVLARGSGQLGLLPPALDVALELAAGAAMALAIVPRMRRFPAAAAAGAAALAAGAALAPFAALLALSILHNLTPLGFVAEALDRRARRRVLPWLAIGFVGLPLLIACGLPRALLMGAGLGDPELNLFAASGPLASNIGVYAPRALSGEWALNAFAASVFAQLMHYVAVILVLPRLPGGSAPKTVLPWPRGRKPMALIAAVSTAAALLFVLDYGLARQLYALAAMVHAWIEIPLLLLLLGGWASGREATA